ncbi:MAG: hypothetical protein ACRC2T_10005 [Thermoguttaceae bacterium]
MNSLDIEKIKANNWLQGKLFPLEAVVKIAAKHFPEVSVRDARLMVVSQSCDIRHFNPKKPEEEPFVEVLLIRPISEECKLCIYGRRQRCYHLKVITDSQQQVWYEAHIDDRFRIDRTFCADFAPCTNLTIPREEIVSIIKWITYRYIRTALPDAFNKQIYSKQEKLKKLISSTESAFISGIFLNIQKDSSGQYEVNILGSMATNNFEDTKNIQLQKSDTNGKQRVVEKTKRAFAETLILEFEALLQSCGIDATSQIESENNISLDKIKQYQRFTDYDYLSYDTTETE